MVKVNIIKENQVSNSAEFIDLDSANHWLVQEEANQSFGPKEDYQIEIKDITQEIEQEKQNQEALAYLAETDWYVIRAMDEQVPIPEDIKAKRQAARLKIKR